MKTGSAPIVLLLLPDAFPSVRDLLFSRSPAAIFWRVVAVVVHAIKAEMLSRSSAHVREEIGEFAPALADANATAAVILETFHVGIRHRACIAFQMPCSGVVLPCLVSPCVIRAGCSFCQHPQDFVCPLTTLYGWVSNVRPHWQRNRQIASCLGK